MDDQANILELKNQIEDLKKENQYLRKLFKEHNISINYDSQNKEVHKSLKQDKARLFFSYF